jgi:predicted transcriptional regulator
MAVMSTPSSPKPATKSVVITARIDPETAALLDKVGAAQGRSRSWLVAQAVKKMAEEEAAYLAFIQEGLDDIAAGRTVPHEEVMAWLHDRYADALERAEAMGSKAA